MGELMRTTMHSPRMRGRWVVALAALLTLIAAGSASLATVPSDAVSELRSDLADRGYMGEVDGVPGLLVFAGDSPDPLVGRVTISRWTGTPEQYAAKFLDARTQGIEDPGETPQASVRVFDGAAYGSSGDVPFAAEWAAVQVGDETILVLRPQEQDGRWVGSALIQWLESQVPLLEESGFQLAVSDTFPSPDG